MKKENLYVIGAVALGFIATRYFLRAREEKKSSFAGKGSRKQTYFCSATGKVYEVSTIWEFNQAQAECMREGGTITRGIWGLTGGNYARAERSSSACGCGA